MGSFAALMCGGCAMVMLLVGSARAQNLLTNGDLDVTSVTTQAGATPTGWNATASRTVSGSFNDGMSSENFANVLQPGGFGLFFKPFQGDTTGVNGKVSATLSQTVAGSPGLPYTLRGWAGAEANYVGLTDATVGSTFHIDFLNAALTPIGTGATLDLRTAGLGQGAPTSPATGFGYHPYTLTATSPAGTAFVTVSANETNAYGNPAGGGQAYVVDSFSLTVPEPASLGACSLLGLAALRRRRAR